MKVYVGEDEGRWPKGTRVKKVRSDPGDTHQDGALGTIVGALGPLSASQRAEMIIELANKVPEPDIEYIYWVEWDDIPGIPVAIADSRIEPIKSDPNSREHSISRLIKQFGEFKKVVRASTGEAFKVPTRDIIEKGIQEQDLDQYPKWVES